uniref:Uncharacterized protein n=1 Tax=viral metagenome TaxID=1070528 RepID=A0A6M3LUZ8_9ZZZZ
MDLEYLKDKPIIEHSVWEAMEDLQEKMPHLWLGWYGFILMIVWA